MPIAGHMIMRLATSANAKVRSMWSDRVSFRRCRDQGVMCSHQSQRQGRRHYAVEFAAGRGASDIGQRLFAVSPGHPITQSDIWYITAHRFDNGAHSIPSGVPAKPAAALR